MYKNDRPVGKFLSFHENDATADDEPADETDGKRIWEEKDVANLLSDLSHFEKKQK